MLGDLFTKIISYGLPQKKKPEEELATILSQPSPQQQELGNLLSQPEPQPQVPFSPFGAGGMTQPQQGPPPLPVPPPREAQFAPATESEEEYMKQVSEAEMTEGRWPTFPPIEDTISGAKARSMESAAADEDVVRMFAPDYDTYTEEQKTQAYHGTVQGLKSLEADWKRDTLQEFRQKPAWSWAYSVTEGSMAGVEGILAVIDQIGDAASRGLASTLARGDKEKQKQIYELTKPKIERYLRENQQKIVADFGTVNPETMIFEVLEGIGAAGTIIPILGIMGKVGGITAYEALRGLGTGLEAKEKPLAVAARTGAGALTGAAIHGTVGALSGMKAEAALPAAFGFGFATDPGGVRERMTSGLVWMGLQLHGAKPNQKGVGEMVNDFLDHYPKAKDVAIYRLVHEMDRAGAVTAFARERGISRDQAKSFLSEWARGQGAGYITGETKDFRKATKEAKKPLPPEPEKEAPERVPQAKITPKEPGVEPEPSAVPEKGPKLSPTPAFGLIRRHGGLNRSLFRGELDSIFESYPTAAKNIIKAKKGMGPDDLAELFQQNEIIPKRDINLALKALEREVAGEPQPPMSLKDAYADEAIRLAEEYRIYALEREAVAEPVMDITKAEPLQTEPPTTNLERVTAELDADFPLGTPDKLGLSVTRVTPAQAAPITKIGEFKWAEDKTEDRYQASGGIPGPTALDKLEAKFIKFRNITTRVYERLPKTAEFVYAKRKLKDAEHAGHVASQLTVENLKRIKAPFKRDKKLSDLFARKIIIDSMWEEVGFGKTDFPYDWTVESVTNDKARLERYLSDNSIPEIGEAVGRYRKIMGAILEDFIVAGEKAGVRNMRKKYGRLAYFHHQILEHAEARTALGLGKRFKTPRGMGWTKKRMPEGSAKDINRDFEEATYEVMSEMIYATYLYEVQAKLEKVYDTKADVKADAKVKGLDDWEEAIPEGRSTFQFTPGRTLFTSDTIPAWIAEEALRLTMEDVIGVPVKDINKVRAIGSPYKTVVFPDELIDTLSHLKPDPPPFLIQAAKDVTRQMKAWLLIGPTRILKYGMRNVSGDLDGVVVGNVSTMKKVPETIELLIDHFVKHEPVKRDDFFGWFKRGGTAGTFMIQELGDIHAVKEFKTFFDKQESLAKKGVKVPLTVWKEYWKKARVSNQFRESILRLASHLDYLDQIRKNPDGLPRNFGASLRKEILGLRALATPEMLKQGKVTKEFYEEISQDMAFQLQNDLLGAYDEVSPLGQNLADGPAPFFRWKEINAKRYKRFVQNAHHSDKMAATIGKKMVSGLVRSPIMAVQYGRLAAKALAALTAMSVWNNLKHPEEEADLSEDTRNRPHLILEIPEFKDGKLSFTSRDKNGNPLHFTRLGALGDLLEWFGADTAPGEVVKFLQGKKSVQEIGKDMWEEMKYGGVNQLVQMINPLAKVPMELAIGHSSFPSITDPRQIRDRYIHIGRSLGLEPEFREIAALAGRRRPGRPYKDRFLDLVAYRSDVNETAYYDWLKVERDFAEELGKGGAGFGLTDRGKALLHMKKAMWYGQIDVAKRYFEKYKQFHLQEVMAVAPATGMTEAEAMEYYTEHLNAGIDSSFKALEPMSQFSKPLQETLASRLTPHEKELLAKATMYFLETILGKENVDWRDLKQE